MWRSLFAAILLAVGGCASNGPVRARTAQPLYFAVEVIQGGKRIGAPKLLGFAGRKITAERRSPGAADPDYRIMLEPEEQGLGYHLAVKLALPSGERGGELVLLHGEERTVPMGPGTELKVMLMRVDSDEFRALVATPGPPDRGQI